MKNPRKTDAIDDAGQTPASPRPQPGRDHEKAREFALAAAAELASDKCTDLVVLDLRGKSQLTDFFVIASGTSDVQMRSAARNVEKIGDAQGMSMFRSNTHDLNPTWIVLDFVDVVVHLFEPQTRLHYDLEMLWGDAPRLTVPGAPGPGGLDRAGLHRAKPTPSEWSPRADARSDARD